MGIPASPPGESHVVLREARRRDRDSFLQVIVGSFGPLERLMGLDKDHLGLIGAVFGPALWFLVSLLKAIGRAPARILVASDGPTVVGTTVWVPVDGFGYIGAVGVRPSHRRRGIAGRLVDRAEKLTAEKGPSWAVLDVESDNAPAIALYRARGYTTIQTARWLRLAGPAKVASPPRPTPPVRAVRGSGRSAAAEWCARQQSERFVAIVPPASRRFTHLEMFAQTPGVRRETWAVGATDRPLAYLIAYWKDRSTPGVILLPAVDPTVPREGLPDLVRHGVGWLAAKGCPHVIAVVPDPADPALPALEELGFRTEVTTFTMAVRVGAP
ncbi:MAG: GNAT family N-acetyltransferase [Thermoplasmata archaeon]|nr:GNAT family N-acetyltransferase [Thermoplasmata archaeon]